MTDLYLDTETYNETDIRVGTYRYAETAEVMLLSYAIDDGPAQVIDFTEGDVTAEFKDAFHDPYVFKVAQNSMFDRNVMRLGRTSTGLQLRAPIEEWDDTMVQALSHALPSSLDELGRVMGLPQNMQKLAEGKKLINRFCKPAPRNHKAERYTRRTHPEEWARFKEYARQDIVAMREIRKRLPTWNWTEQDRADWHLDQHINDRGFKVDLELARAGARAAEQEKAAISERFAELTGGLAPSQRAKVQAYLNETYGLGLTATAKHIMAPLSVDPTVPEEVREIACLVLSANKTSTAKYAAIADAVSSDGRFRGGLQFAGARRTRRWAGRIFQGQNLPSRGIPKDVDSYIAALKAGAHDLLFNDLMRYGAAAIRGLIVA